MLEILVKGMFTTVQDMGRPSYQNIGVPVCGAMDRRALAHANLLVGNEPDEGALEITGMGPSVRFHQANLFAVAGAQFDLRLDGVLLQCGKTYLAPAGSTLTMGWAKAGFRAYLAVAGGFDLPYTMASYSTCMAGGFGGLEGRPLQNGDCIGFRDPQCWLPGLEQREIEYTVDLRSPVRVVLGPQDDMFSEEGIATFLSGQYRVTDKSDRMGYRTEGPAIAMKEGLTPNIISDGIAAGSVQVPNGCPIVMMADHQTVGGYAKIATVISVDLPLIAQRRPGDTLTFAAVDMREAQRLYRMEQRRLRFLQQDLACRWNLW